jgi:glucose/arabinose dehydrogenase
MKKLFLLGFSLFSLIGFSQTIVLQSYATGFSSPVDIAHPANDTRLFVVQKGGLIRIVKPVGATGTVNTTPFLNLSTLVSTGSEQGLLGLAFHPNYATNGFFFVNYTNTAGNTVIARYSVSTTNPDISNTTATILMTINQPSSNHNGGCLRFGTDGFLYIGMGDGGGAGDTSNYSQNLTISTANPTRVYLGKMLRIDVDSTVGALNYGYPATNPYISEAGKQEIWARGLRNPWKFSFNRLNGDLWIGDVGQGAKEEIDFIANPLPTGLNFGWRCYEGNSTYNTAACAAMSTMTFPVAEYTHAGGACSITGGYIYTGSTYPNFANKYFFADYCLNRLGYVNATTNAITYTPNFTTSNNFTTFGEDLNGELYVTGGSVLYKITDSSLSNSEFEKNGFALYPNPAKNEFSIKNTNNIALTKVEVFDLSGKLLLTNSVSDNQTISIASLSSGLYLVTVHTETGTVFNTKLVVE